MKLNHEHILSTRPLRRPLAKPSLILMMGVAGTGKSTLAREITRRIWAVYLDNNDIADGFFPETRNGKQYEKLRPGFYKVMYRVTERNLRIGNTVLLDVPHIKEVQTRQWQSFIRKLAESTGTKLVVIRCLCSESVLRRRIDKRGEQRDMWKLRHWDEFLASQPIDVLVPFPHLDVNTEKSLSRNAAAAIRYIRKQANSTS